MEENISEIEPKKENILVPNMNSNKIRIKFVLLTTLISIILIIALLFLGLFIYDKLRVKTNTELLVDDTPPHSSINNTQLQGNTATVTVTPTTTTTTSNSQTDLVLDPNKNYGNKYANGLLPVGDKKYVTNAAKKGYVFECNNNFVPESQAGAQTRGPWFTNNNTQWDINKKVSVSGNVMWQPLMKVTTENGKRIITTNDLPNHKTGLFPVSKTDTAYKYDRNPNTITDQNLTYTLEANPSAGNPQCIGGEVGIMLTGVALFNAFDAGGRDAGAWEVQDGCDGHPQEKGEYHYHTLSRCITDQSINTVLGYALDGFAITGPKLGDSNILTTDDLDECHGITSEIDIDGKKIKTYHYVMTQDFPYSVSCFRNKASQPPRSSNIPMEQPGLTKRPGM